MKFTERLRELSDPSSVVPSLNEYLAKRMLFDALPAIIEALEAARVHQCGGSESSESWNKKNLDGCHLRDRLDALGALVEDKMTDVTEMSDEELIGKVRAFRPANATQSPSTAYGLVRELASRLEAALERERLDVEAFGRIVSWLQDNDDLRDYPVLKDALGRLAARETKG